MTSKAECLDNPVARSRCIIQAILDDIGETYKPIGGGGISRIELTATDVYRVSISQEERVDQITYTVEVAGDGSVVFTKRETGTKSFRR